MDENNPHHVHPYCFRCHRTFLNVNNRTQCSRCGGALYLTSHLLIQENPLSHLSDLLSIFGIGRVIPGLSEQQISRIPKVRVTAEEQHDNLGCVICLINFAERENVSKLNCNHMFHVRCISEWLKTHKTCPNCRADVKPTRQNLMMSMHNLSHDDDDVDPVLVFVERENTAVRAAEVGAAIAPAEPPIQLVQDPVGHGADRVLRARMRSTNAARGNAIPYARAGDRDASPVASRTRARLRAKAEHAQN